MNHAIYDLIHQIVEGSFTLRPLNNCKDFSIVQFFCLFGKLSNSYHSTTILLIIFQYYEGTSCILQVFNAYVQLNLKCIIHSEGGTDEIRRINPYLNFGNFIKKTIIMIGNNWFRSSPRLKKISDPHLDKIRSALIDHS